MNAPIANFYLARFQVQTRAPAARALVEAIRRAVTRSGSGEPASILGATVDRLEDAA
jgi:hypothetical protein